MQTTVRTAVLPVAGRGTRLLPATKSVPKELLPVYDRPLLQYAVDEARAAGITRLILVSHPDKSAIQHYFERDTDLRDALDAAGKDEMGAALDRLDPTDDLEVVVVHQDEPLGLGHAILCARALIDAGDAFAVILPDDLILSGEPTIGEMARAYEQGGCAHMLGTQSVPREDTAKYGICDCDAPKPGQHLPVNGLVEKPDPQDAPSQMAVIGRYILDASIFAVLADTAPGAGDEIQLTDAIAAAIASDGVSAFHIAGTRYDCGHADGLLAASNAMQERQADVAPFFAA